MKNFKSKNSANTNLCLPLNFKSLMELKILTNEVATLMSPSLSICNNPTDINKIYYDFYAPVTVNCHKLCTTSEYKGKVQTTDGISGGKCLRYW